MSKRVKLIGLLKAKPGMNRAEYERRYLEVHAPLAKKFKNISGLHFSVVDDALQAGAGEPPYDGVVEFWWDSVENMRKDFASPEMAAAGADADQFQTFTLLYAREHIIK